MTTPCRKLTRALLGTTCLTMAAGAANASTYTEGVDLPNLSGLATLLPLGTDTVVATAPGGDVDYFIIQGLTPGAQNFTVSLPLTGAYYLNVWNDTFTAVLGGGSGVFSVNVPGNGRVGIQAGSEEGVGATYSVAVSSLGSPVPEPGTMGLAGLALAGAIAWRRRRSNA